MILALNLVLYLYLFWVAYIAVMGCYRAHLDGRLTGVVKYLAYPIVVIGIILDVTTQYTIATVVFLDPPAKGEYMVTSRLKRYIQSQDSWRERFASWICNNLLDMFDPSGNHC